MAFGLPPDSAIAISAAMNAWVELPPACSQSCSRPEQLYMPCEVRWTSVDPPLFAGAAACLGAACLGAACLTVSLTVWVTGAAAGLECFGAELVSETLEG